MAKLSAHDVRLIKALLRERDEAKKRWQSLSARSIARKFDVSRALIDAIACGQQHKGIAE